MRHATAAFVCALLAVPATAGPTVNVYEFPLDGVEGIITPGFGSGLVTFEPGSGALTWDIEYMGLVGEAFAAHFHGPARPGQEAPVRFNLTGTIMPIDPTRGRIAGSGTIGAAMAAELTAGLWYVNIHTTFALEGELRGQVVHDPPCFADLNDSGDVGFADLLIVLGAWGPCGTTAGGTGACCSVAGVCVDDVTAALCTTLGAFFQGDGSQCADADVNCERACAPDLDGSGDVGFADVLRVIADWGACG